MNSQMPAADGSPAISVIMPLYNKAQYVERAVKSVLAQDYLDYELLIVDDGSTDDGVARVQARFNDARVKIIRQPNAGVGAARNRAIRQARGMLFAFLDADDEWRPYHLSDLLYLATHFASAGIFASGIACQFEEKLAIDITARTAVPCLIENYFALMSRLRGAILIHSSSCAIRREVVTSLGGFLENTPYGEDTEYWARINLCYPMAFHPTVSSIYRTGIPGSAMSARRWTAAEMPVVRTLKGYLATHTNSANRSDVLNYGAWIVMNQAVAGIVFGESKAVRRLLADPILTQSRFQRRLRVLRIAAAVPTPVARAAIHVHHSAWLSSWQRMYMKLIASEEPT